MKRSKVQDPRSREDPRFKLQSDTWPNETSYEKIALRQSIMLHDGPKNVSKHPFGLLERTAVYGESIVRFSKRIPRGPTNDRLIDQLVGCGTSVGGNYCEANEDVSKKDFRHPISRCIKEAKETKFFVRMLVASEPELAEEARLLYREANELLLIFSSMYRK